MQTVVIVAAVVVVAFLYMGTNAKPASYLRDRPTGAAPKLETVDPHGTVNPPGTSASVWRTTPRPRPPSGTGTVATFLNATGTRVNA